MKLLVDTVKHYWKVLVILSTVSGTVVAASVWVGKVESHVTQGNEKIQEFDESQIGQARIETKLDAVKEDVGEVKQDVDEIKKQLNRMERKLDRGTR